ncbi:MAG TPA: hypothetical protein QF564_18870, partial [Pirellulaceae bacterium]|nr:hypothetical protein [Pirellulaceae bacterium]
MTCKAKQLLRLAIAIHEHLKGEQSTTHLELPTTTWQRSEQMLRQMRLGHQHGWHLATHRLQRDLREMLRRLHGELTAIDCMLEPSQDESHQVSTNDIYADLVALRKEFDEVRFDRRERTLTVTTEPIELDGINLGPFEIRLDWSNLIDGHPGNYRVVAIDANPASTNDTVTHPHVQDEAVCEGEGRQPIRCALEQGRLLDFFVIVGNLLRTYNSGSPYVSLSDWHGVECADCGATACDDERWTCEKCQTTVCGECYFSCPGCDSICCNTCVTHCEGCDEVHCSACTQACARCHAEI